MRREGYSVVQDDFDIGLVSVAVPLRDTSGEVVAPMSCASIGGPEIRNALGDRVKLLLNVSEQINSGFRFLPALPFQTVRDFT